MNNFTFIFLITLVISFVIQLWLSARQKSFVLAHKKSVPDAFKNTISLVAHKKAADYTVEKSRLSDVDGVISIVVLLLLTLGGGINFVCSLWADFNLSPMLKDILSVVVIFLLLSLLEIPSSLYGIFVIEEKFSFNKTTWLQFFKDQLISLSLTLIIGFPLLALIVWVMDNIGHLWWLLAWSILISVSLLMSWLFPTVIAPLFNKFTPIQDGDLKNRIKNLLNRCGFNSKGIFIMDGSRRSGHGNAYFTGLGNNKRIVFYDTLVKSLDAEELEAVLAHELGHFKCKHVIKMLVSSSIISLLGFALLGWLIEQNWFFSGLGVSTDSNAVALLLFALISPVFTGFMQPISAYFQRKFEFEADAFASHHTKASKLISGLVKLYEENASTLTPDPLFAAFYYSHPPAAIRIANLESNKTV